jgi:GT2 family glycosyltransferase
MKLLSVVIPIHSKAPRLRLTLAGLRGQVDQGDVQLIIAADQATEAVRAVLRDETEAVIVESSRRGRAAARNAGAARADGETLVFVDDDILVESDFLRCHRQAQAKSPGLVHGALREIIGLLRVEDPAQGGPGCPPVEVGALRAGEWHPVGVRLVTNALEQAAEHPDAVGWPWLACAGANLSVPRCAWESVGGFDEGYGASWGMEDVDFAYRLWAMAVPISLAPAAVGYHMSHHHASRWDEQRDNMKRFQARAACPEALALPALLSARGSLRLYREAVDHIRQCGIVPPWLA